jgi:hypothetical protein
MASRRYRTIWLSDSHLGTRECRAQALVAREWFLWTLLVVGGPVLYLVRTHDLQLALVWSVKLATDPVTDLIAYSPRYLRRV